MPVDLSEALEEHRRGNLEWAASAYASILAADPNQPDALYLSGVIALQTGDPQQAALSIDRAAMLRPSDPVIHANLAEAYRALGDNDRAIASYQTAVRLDPSHPDIHCNLALALVNRGEPQGASVHYREALRLQPENAAAHHGLGKLLQSSGQLAEAKDCFVQAARLIPGHATCHVSLGHVYEQLGEFDQAIASFREALRCDPRQPGALAQLASRLRDKLPQADEAAIEDVLADPGLPLEPSIQLRLALAQAFDARGDFDRAAALTTQANSLQLADYRNRGVAYDPIGHHHFTTQLMGAFSPAYFERVRGWGIATVRPVFIVGLPRSGTTLTEQILASHPCVYGAGELTLTKRIFQSLPGAATYGGMPLDYLPLIDRDCVQELGRRYLEELSVINDRADRVVDKMPDNTAFLGLIATIFPQARIIYCRRDLRDVALSCWMTDFRDVRWACDPESIALRIHEHERLMNHWRQVLPTPMLELEYEALVTDLEQWARVLVDWCGLEWDPACLEFHKTNRPVQTSSVAQVRRPIYTSSVGRWKNYEKTLAPLFAKLEGRG